MEYTVLIHQAEEGGFWAEVPELPGCYSQGETFDEIVSNSREAIEAHLLGLERGIGGAPMHQMVKEVYSRLGNEERSK